MGRLAGQRLGIKEVDDGIWISCITISASSISNRKPLDNRFGTGL
jgi:hypothetical protein